MKKNSITVIGLIIMVCGCVTLCFSADEPTFLSNEKYYEGIPYMSGGIGLDEREALSARCRDYSLKLIFAVQGGEFLADVEVRISDSTGKKVLDGVSEGPWFYTNIPSGNYTVSATLTGKPQQQAVSIDKKGQKTLRFYWK